MSIPIKKRGMHRVPWGTTEFRCLRKHVNAARRRFQRCKSATLKEIYKSHSSKEKFLNKGCPQASVSGPFLWNVIINDFFGKKSWLSLPVKRLLLLPMTYLFASWEKFNAVKSKFMFLEKRENNALNSSRILHGFSLDCMKELKYLVLDNKFCWKQHVLHFSNKYEKNLLGFNIVVRNSLGIKSNVLSLIYKQGIVPFIWYGSRIWGSALKKKINCRLLRKIKRRILLRVISGYRTIFYEAVFAILGFPPIDIFII
ncbi:UNVERIFIED_CONTAM: hypothetical protein NCL1_37352 [Trichonephila clavipes]